MLRRPGLLLKRITWKKPKPNSTTPECQSQQMVKDILERLLAHHNLSLDMSNKVIEWVNEVKRRSSIAVTQPHAAYAAFTHGLKHKWTYLIRTIPNIDDQLQPLEDVIRHKFIPSLTGQSALSDETRDLMALPIRHGGLGITNPTRNNTSYHQSSENITAPLVSLILEQSHMYHQEAKAEQLSAKKEAGVNNQIQQQRQSWRTS